MPLNTPYYWPGVQGHSYVYGAEYEGPPLVTGSDQHNAPCALCYIPTKHTVIMIPAKTSCRTTISESLIVWPVVNNVLLSRGV